MKYAQRKVWYQIIWTVADKIRSNIFITIIRVVIYLATSKTTCYIISRDVKVMYFGYLLFMYIGIRIINEYKLDIFIKNFLV